MSNSQLIEALGIEEKKTECLKTGTLTPMAKLLDGMKNPEMQLLILHQMLGVNLELMSEWQARIATELQSKKS